MRQMPLLLSVVALAALVLADGCAGGGGSQEGQSHEETNHDGSHDGSHNGSAKVELRPEGDSRVSATASFEDASDGVVVKLEVRGLPKPDTFYLSHVHHGTCSEEGEAREHAEEGEASEHAEHSEAGKEHGHGEEIEYPLNQVKSDSEGRGTSTTTLDDTSVKELFSGEPKLVNVHEAGSGDPPILACADLRRAG
jgi:hypothetical protein